MEPAMFAAMGAELAGSPHKARSHEAVVHRLEAALAKQPYVMGESFSAADFLISSALAFGRNAFPESALFDAYVERCRTRPAAIRSQALDGASGPQGVRQSA